MYKEKWNMAIWKRGEEDANVLDRYSHFSPCSTGRLLGGLDE
jgi:hypothetical protein